ncbi:MAG TPA: SCP2 sterol-binding domain-containing protein [Candidatus Dormibacteraeota bacterium]
MTDTSAAEIFAAIDAALAASPDAALALDASYVFDLGGEGGGLFHIVAQDGTRGAGPGAIAEPSATIVMTAADLVELRTGKLNATLAFLDGRLRIRGDHTAALRLVELLTGGPA